MSVTCPQGHASETDDFCDVCGEPIAAGAGPASAASGSPASTPPPASSLNLDPPSPAMPPVPAQECANCGEQNPADALFCESCGYDFTTGQVPEPTPPMADPGAAWVTEVTANTWTYAVSSPGATPATGTITRAVPSEIGRAHV